MLHHIKRFYNKCWGEDLNIYFLAKKIDISPKSQYNKVAQT